MNNDFREYISWYDAKKIYKKKNMNRYEQEYYNNIKRIADALVDIAEAIIIVKKNRDEKKINNKD